MQDFKIRRGLSTLLFSEPGVINPKLVIEEGCWYLCTDTAELFLGISTNGKLSLKQINEAELPDYGILIDELKKELEAVYKADKYIRIEDESELPTDFATEAFDPNITYYIVLEDDRVNTYIFDKSMQCYLCTSSVNEGVLRDIVLDTINFTFVEELVTNQLPSAIKQVLETTVLHGGTAH